jgi:hypothetical protein
MRHVRAGARPTQIAPAGRLSWPAETTSPTLNKVTWLTEGVRPHRYRGMSPTEWRCLWPNPRRV